MAEKQYTELRTVLTDLNTKSPRNSESQNAITCGEAVALIRASNLSQNERNALCNAALGSANPTGWYYQNNGIQAAITLLEQYENQEEKTPASTGGWQTLNRANLKNLVSDGAIFSVEFVKRSNGQLRKMVCRMGVKKYLKGGGKAYKSKTYDLLTVFDMKNKGYRSIPVDAIQRLCVNGQVFTFAGV